MLRSLAGEVRNFSLLVGISDNDEASGRSSASPRVPRYFFSSHLESKLTTLSKDGLLLGWRALMATGGATGASDHGEPCKWSKSADQIPALVKRSYQKTENTLRGEL